MYERIVNRGLVVKDYLDGEFLCERQYTERELLSELKMVQKKQLDVEFTFETIVTLHEVEINEAMDEGELKYFIYLTTYKVGELSDIERTMDNEKLVKEYKRVKSAHKFGEELADSYDCYCGYTTT